VLSNCRRAGEDDGRVHYRKRTGDGDQGGEAAEEHLGQGDPGDLDAQAQRIAHSAGVHLAEA